MNYFDNPAPYDVAMSVDPRTSAHVVTFQTVVRPHETTGETIALVKRLADDHGRLADRALSDARHENRLLFDMLRRLVGQDDLSPWLDGSR